MRIAAITSEPLIIPFKAVFTHAAASRVVTQSIWVEAKNAGGIVGLGEGCPRDYVTGETSDSATRFVTTYRQHWIDTIFDIDSLKSWVANHQAEIDANPAAWSAVEIAILDLIGKENGCSVECLLGIPELTGQFHYTAVLGDASAKQFEAQLVQYVQAGFQIFKIKLSGDSERDLAKIAALRALGIKASSVRADANNLWQTASQAMRFLDLLDFDFWALEEPLLANDLNGMLSLAKARSCRIILDESLLRLAQLDQLQSHPEQWIVNLRISKMGGVLRSLALVQRLQRNKIDLIVGAHVGETSVLTRAALSIAQAGKSILIAQEGAFGSHLLEHDVVEPEIRFGIGGNLDVEKLAVSGKSGFGLCRAANSAVTSA